MLDVGCLQLATCDVVGWLVALVALVGWLHWCWLVATLLVALVALVALVGWLHWLAGCIGVGWLQRCWLVALAFVGFGCKFVGWLQ